MSYSSYLCPKYHFWLYSRDCLFTLPCRIGKWPKETQTLCHTINSLRRPQSLKDQLSLARVIWLSVMTFLPPNERILLGFCQQNTDISEAYRQKIHVQRFLGYTTYHLEFQNKTNTKSSVRNLLVYPDLLWKQEGSLLVRLNQHSLLLGDCFWLKEIRIF